MQLHGENLLGGVRSKLGPQTLAAIDPMIGSELGPRFHEATAAEVDRAMELAGTAFADYSETGPGERARFLRGIASQLEMVGDALVERASAETGLGSHRLVSELARTTGQLRMFADLIEEGSWVDARIDSGGTAGEAKPDLRRMLVALGPVVVFGASNFPFAFSVAGGDTASALAAGCPVVVKAHPAHPGTSELSGRAVLAAAEAARMPQGVFSLVQGAGHEVGGRLVEHPHTKAVGFTGSLRAGRALFDLAAARPEPIPVYAEMGSSNPVFLLPHAVNERTDAIAMGLTQSMTLGVGQFCTQPGLVVGLGDDGFDRLLEKTSVLVSQVAPGTMLYPGICTAFHEGVERLGQTSGVKLIASAERAADAARNEAGARLFATDGDTLLAAPHLAMELFGPSTLFVRAGSTEELEAIAASLTGHLTATLHGNDEELQRHHRLVAILKNKVGRLIFNGYPTGVAVNSSMQHGGPYPATTDSRTTSVGTAAIQRFVRPVAYQDFPQGALPSELRNENERGILRLVNNRFTRAPL